MARDHHADVIIIGTGAGGGTLAHRLAPSGKRTKRTLWEVADDLSRRLTHIFLRGPDGRRPVFGTNDIFHTDPHWRDFVPFHEFFHGDTGAGLGASHQTGWTALVAKLLEQTKGK